MQPGSEHTPDGTQGEHFYNSLREASRAYRKVQKLLGPAALFLSPEAVKSLETLRSEHWSIAQFSSCTADYVEEASALAETAYGNVLREAKKQLQLADNDAYRAL